MKLFNKKKIIQAAACDVKKFDLTAAMAEIEILQAAAGEPAKQPTFKIEAYNGGKMNVTGFYRPVVIDLSGLRAAALTTVLKDHDFRQIVGQGTAKITSKSVTIAGQITGDITKETDPSYVIMTHHKNGFVWAASVGVEIDTLEYLDAGQSAKVNGQKIEGPSIIVRAGRLGEVSFVGIGADETATAKIAANAVETTHKEQQAMKEFETWLKAKGWNYEELSDDQRTTLKAQFDLEQKPKKDKGDEANGETVQAQAPVDPMQQQRVQAAAEIRRVDGIRRVCGDKHGDLCAKAVEENWTVEKAELEVLKASRPQPPMTKDSQPMDHEPLVLEAALCMTAGLKTVEKQYPEKVLEAAHKQHRGLGLQQLLIQAACQGGHVLRAGERIGKSNIKNVLYAAFSTNDISGVLSNVANKFALEQFMFVEQAWRPISRIRPVSDFKTITSYRLTGGGGYEKVAPTGEIKHGNLGNDSFTNKADTYGEMLSITRQDIINDDLGVLSTGAPAKLGRDAGLKINDVFWAEWLDNSTFFASGYSNVSASSALSIAGLKKVVIAFYKLKDSKGKLIGSMPAILLVPTDLEVDATNIFTSALLNEAATSGSPAPSKNPYVGKYRVVASRYLSDTSITGYSATSYYLLADPRDIAAIEVAFLDGVETPTIEEAQADFNTLGIQMRGYHDFGVNKQDPRAGVRGNQ